MNLATKSQKKSEKRLVKSIGVKGLLWFINSNKLLTLSKKVFFLLSYLNVYGWEFVQNVTTFWVS